MVTWKDRLKADRRSSEENKDKAEFVRRICNDLDSYCILEMACAIATRYNVTISEMVGPSHMRGPSTARHAMWTALRDGNPRYWSYPLIGKLFRRDHTTIMTGVARFRQLSEKTPPEEGLHTLH